MGDLVIKKLTLADSEALTEISVTTFRETFESDNTPDDMERYVRESLSAGEIENELQAAENEFYAADLDGRMIGYLKLVAQSETRIEISRLYVLKEFLSQKVGARLMSFAIETAKAQGFQTIFLGVWEYNERAIHFYQKWGFSKSGEQIFQLGNDPQTDWVMERAL